jgi:uncharacterized SAM-binding protein YcdF (DUF218 family)
VRSGLTISIGLVLAAALVLMGARPLALWLARPLVKSDPLRHVDAIAVLGGGVYDETTLAPESAYRLLYAVQLFKSGYAPTVILAGGSHRGARGSDAEVMARAALALGIEPSSLLLDTRPSSTAEQAASIAKLAAERGIRSVVVVTSPLKSYRAARTLQRAGLDVVSAPGTAAGPDRAAPLLVAEDHVARRLGLILEALYEYAVIAVYWWRGLI